MFLVNGPRQPAPAGDCLPGWLIWTMAFVPFLLQAAAHCFHAWRTFSSSFLAGSNAMSPLAPRYFGVTWTFPASIASVS